MPEMRNPCTPRHGARSALEAVLRILGIPVADDDVRHLVATLVVEGTPDALTAAAQLARVRNAASYAIGLRPGERAAVTERVRPESRHPCVTPSAAYCQP